MTSTKERIAKNKDLSKPFPVLPLKNSLIVPHIITPILVGRKPSLEAVENAQLTNSDILCITQKKEIDDKEDVKAKDLYRMGTLCKILQIFRLPDGSARILIEGKSRVKVIKYSKSKRILRAEVNTFNFETNSADSETKVLLRVLKKTFTNYVKNTNGLPEEVLKTIKLTNDTDKFFYFALLNIHLDLKFKQKIFEKKNMKEAITLLLEELENEISLLLLEKSIDKKVKNKLSKLQREYYLNEQLRAINKELGIDQEGSEDITTFRNKIKETNFTDEAQKKAEEELRKLSKINYHSPEFGVINNYLNWLLDIPWEEPAFIDFSLKQSLAILNKDHYGLKKVKGRILEFLAVMKIAGKVKGQILCFVGPPGVGKTSLGKSIAKALDREFVRLSLGGVRDEAEIRGHRRTYIGAMPGIIIQSMKKSGTKNPLIMMDEIDKMSSDFRGDPSSALLEVLDSEQNDQFRDHYLDIGYDLSDVFFITTANNLSTIPQPLLDRMEIIHLPGYTAYEKKNIAIKHLISKQLKAHFVEDKLSIEFSDSAINTIISKYTREAGVRGLERKIAEVIRKIVREYVENPKLKKVKITNKNIEKYLGIASYLYSEVNDKDQVGIVTGLAWTAHGGETLQIEIVKLKGDGKIKLTGQLGDVMKESAQAALSYARLHASEFDIDENFYKECDLHLHIPEGGIPKDGPSAGVTMVTAIISILSGRKVRHNLAMTGEITLSGNVLPIGGLEEKLIAAKRAKITKVLIPAKNAPKLQEIQKEIRKDLEIIPVETIDDVLKIALI